MEAGLLIKSEPDLRGNRKGTSTLVLADIWALQQWIQLSFPNVALPGRSAQFILSSLGTRAPESQVLANLPAALS